MTTKRPHNFSAAKTIINLLKPRPYHYRLYFF